MDGMPKVTKSRFAGERCIKVELDDCAMFIPEFKVTNIRNNIMRGIRMLRLFCKRLERLGF